MEKYKRVKILGKGSFGKVRGVGCIFCLSGCPRLSPVSNPDHNIDKTARFAKRNALFRMQKVGMLRLLYQSLLVL